jgi:hypothetical protein|tara:strand:+ start:3557 stop:4237 length:681 start_codon:yes stop_codon:yes gene_type:complete
VPTETREVRPFPAKPGHVLSPQGEILAIPEGWALLAPGDAALSRRLKANGPTWTVKQAKGRRVISLGIWAPADRIEALRQARESEKTDPSYQKQLAAGRARRAKQEEAYGEDFKNAVLSYLSFHENHRELAGKMTERIVAHAIPVGSGTVARTKRIPIEQRAEAATIAWMRHQTTAYDTMHIPRIKGQRREVRRKLAQYSKQLIECYRRGEATEMNNCPLQASLIT